MMFQNRTNPIPWGYAVKSDDDSKTEQNQYPNAYAVKSDDGEELSHWNQATHLSRFIWCVNHASFVILKQQALPDKQNVTSTNYEN